jgi:hypothetical protein
VPIRGTAVERPDFLGVEAQPSSDGRGWVCRCRWGEDPLAEDACFAGVVGRGVEVAVLESPAIECAYRGDGLLRAAVWRVLCEQEQRHPSVCGQVLQFAGTLEGGCQVGLGLQDLFERDVIPAEDPEGAGNQGEGPGGAGVECDGAQGLDWVGVYGAIARCVWRVEPVKSQIVVRQGVQECFPDDRYAGA